MLPAVFLLFLICGAAALGALARKRLPERHRSRESMEVVQVTITLLVTFTSIVLGLLTGSVKSGFDAAYHARGTYAAQFVELDQCLRDYGPQTEGMRQKLRGYVAAVIASTWPDEPPPAKVQYPDVEGMAITGESPKLGAILNSVRTELRELQPKDAGQQRVLSDCESQFSDLARSRWEVIEGARQSISGPFYWVLTLWLIILFASIGLTASPNPLTIIIISLSALSITIAVAVIIDLDQPYGGVFGIPSTSMRNALGDMNR
jgi:hypothetical protein